VVGIVVVGTVVVGTVVVGTVVVGIVVVGTVVVGTVVVGTVVVGTVVVGTVVVGTVVVGTVVVGMVVVGTVVVGTVVVGTVVGGGVIGVRATIGMAETSPLLTTTWVLHGIYPFNMSSTVRVPTGMLSMIRASRALVLPTYWLSIYTLAPAGSELIERDPVRGENRALMTWSEFTL